MKFARLVFAALVLATFALHAQSPDDQYVRIYQVIQEADRLNAAGQSRTAAAKYLEAQEGLERFQKIFPGWNERVINYRLSYVATKLAPLAASIPANSPTTNAPPITNAAPSPNIADTQSAATLLFPNMAVTNKPPPANAPPAVPPGPSPEIQQQLTTLQAEVERLRTENNRLGAKLKEALSVQPASVDPRELARAEERVRNLEKENELLRVRVRLATNAPQIDATAELKMKVTEQADVIAALRAENEILKKRDLVTNQTPPPAAAQELRQIDSLRARVAVLEAKPVPYSAEELALLSKGGAVTPAANFETSTAKTTTQQRASKQLPPGAGPLVADAEHAFATGNYPEAESKYREVLRQDENNISILANLASALLEMNRVEEAEKHVQRAVSLDAEDYFALYVLGRVKFRQDKMDDALDALSRSAKANPDYAETQNYLGIVLSEKGLRIPAETALRRAIQLQPGHAAAHNNLAVVYATQTPPAMALARWHYQKAIAAGHPKNAELEKLLEEKR